MRRATRMVWRFQNRDGGGPYNSLWAHALALQNAHRGDPSHPSPYRDDMDVSDGEIAGYHSEGARYGFLRKSEALEWFDGWIEKLSGGGFELVRVKGKILAVGRSQVLFQPLDSGL